MRVVCFVDQQVHLGERPDPRPASHELLVRVAAAGLNGADLMQRAGLYPPPAGTDPDVPGLEMAGTVEAIGERVTAFSVGDQVMGLLPGAGQAELVVIHERIALAVPETMEFAAVGGFMEAFSAAYDALFTQGGLGLGDRILINGAAGGVGSAAIELARATGASPVASVRDPARRAALASEGVLAVAPEEAFAHGPFQVILELVGAPNLDADISSLATRGVLVVIGIGGGARAELDLRRLMACQGRISSSTLRVRPLEEKARLARDLERHVLPGVSDGRLCVRLDRTFVLDDAPAAYEYFAGGGKLGKIVLLT